MLLSQLWNNVIEVELSLIVILFLFNKVDRKLVKQTVMTSVYGVTFIGAREQIKKRLKERGVTADDRELFGASSYAARVRKRTLLSPGFVLYLFVV